MICPWLILGSLIMNPSMPKMGGVAAPLILIPLILPTADDSTLTEGELIRFAGELPVLTEEL